MKVVARNLGLSMAGFLAVLIAGFWIPYLSGIPHFDPDITAAMHVHAAALFAWVALLLIQPAAIYGGAYRLHRVLGTMSLVVMALVVLTSSAMLHQEFLERIQAGATAGDALKGEYLSSTQLLLLVCAYSVSLVAARRRWIDVHWRLIVFIILVLLPAGLARTLGYWFDVPQVIGQGACMAFNAAVLIALLIYDIRSREHWAVYIFALASYLLMACGWVALGRPV